MPESDWQNERRRFLKATALAGTVGVAGCTSGNNTSAEEDGSTPTEGDGSGNGGGSQTNDSPTAKPKRGGTLNFAQTSSPVALDPIHNKGGNYSIMIKEKVFSPLFWYDEKTNLTPLLATEIPELTNGGTEFTISIDGNATFHNGDPVTAEDVKYTFTQPVKEKTSWASSFGLIDSISIEDEKTAHFTLKQPYKPILYAMAFPIVPKAVREQDREAFGTETIVGSGPWQVTEFQEGDHVTMERWDDYWGPSTPNLEKVVWTPINEPTNRVTQMKTGDQDVINRIPPKLWNTVDGQQGTSVVSGPGLNYQFAAFNQKEGECSKLKVRQAIDACVNLDAAVQKYIDPVGQRVYSPLPTPIAKAWDMPVEKWQGMWSEKDIDKAKTLFEEAGVPDDWTCKIVVSSTQKRKQMAVGIANGIKEAGYDASVQYLDFAKMLEIYNSGDASKLNIYLLGWSRAPEPDRFLYELLHIDGAFQGQYYDNDRFNELLQKAHTAIDHEKRRELYIEAINLFIEDRVHLPLYSTKVSMGVNDYVKGLNPHPVSTQNPYIFGERLNAHGDVKGTNVWLDE